MENENFNEELQTTQTPPQDQDSDVLFLTPEQYKKEKANQVSGTPEWFILLKNGLYIAEFKEPKKEGQVEYYELEKISGPIFITANVRNMFDEDWGVLVRYKDISGTPREYLAKRQALVGRVDWYNDCVSLLSYKGLLVLDESSLREYLRRFKTNNLQTEITYTGWYKDCFILPNKIIGKCKDDIYFNFILYSDFSCQGSLDDWKGNIGKYCELNPRLNFAVSCAFAAPLLKLCGIEGGGFHFYGQSSCGKTTLLRVASSVCGGKDFMNNWRVTINGIEGLAEKRNDTLMVLDEIGQSDPYTIGDTIYMLANGQGKTRANIKGDPRKTKKWLNLFLSTGEYDLYSHMKTAQKTTKDGQDIRLLSIPAISENSQYGIFDNIYQFSSSAKFADYFIEKTQKYYGTPLVEFLENLVEHQSEIEFEFEKYFLEQKQHYDQNFDGITNRAFKRFALVGFAGEKATEWGITGWNKGSSTSSALLLFENWKDNPDRMSEWDKLKHQVRTFFATHPKYKVSEFAGEWADTERWVFPEIYKDYVVVGFNPRQATKKLVEWGWIIPGNEKNHYQQKKRNSADGVPKRVYVFDIKKMYSDVL